MGVLEGHAPDDRHAARRHRSRCTRASGSPTSMFVAGGFAEVTPERCTVLANEVLPPADLSREEGERRWPRPRPPMRTVDASDVVAEELALERIQSARALVEAVDALLTGR